jgi:hypothetical protein
VKKLNFILIYCLLSLHSVAQVTQYVSEFDYKNINTNTFLPMSGWSNTEKHVLTVTKHCFALKEIISHPIDTIFSWTGLKGMKSIYTKDSLIMTFLRPDDTLKRPCILLSHGNSAKYRSSWNENLNFYAIDLAMRGFCVAYYENPSSFDAKDISAVLNTNNSHIIARPRNAFYNGFQSAMAANIFVMHNADLLKADTTKLFAGGYSFGAFISLMMLTADSGRNFSDTIFDSQGDFSNKSIFNSHYTKSIRSAFAIGGGLPKDDTTFINGSRMGEFLDAEDSGLSLLFLHGRTDNFVSFDLTKLAESNEDTAFFWGEGPRALMNNIIQQQYPVSAKLVVNCKGGHGFLTSVCGYSNPFCLPQWQWQYLLALPDDLSSTNPYFQDVYRDSLLRYIVYMQTQLHDVNAVISDFLQPAVSGNPSLFQNSTYYIQPIDSFTFNQPEGYYSIRSADCEGNAIVISSTKQPALGNNAVRIYPNPADNKITIESKENILLVSVYNMLGELEIQINQPHLPASVDLSKLENGQYLVSIVLQDGMITKKIIVYR